MSPIALTTSATAASLSLEKLKMKHVEEESEAYEELQPSCEEEIDSEMSSTSGDSEDLPSFEESEQSPKTEEKKRRSPGQGKVDHKFRLPKEFINTYSQRQAPFGYNGLGELVYLRTYSRLIPGMNRKEKWYETVERVVNGTYTMQKQWIVSSGLEWNDSDAVESAKEMYERIFTMKFLPPGRGLWAMGTPLTEEKGLYAALNNCAFVSTFVPLSTDLHDESLIEPYCFLMDAAMLGIGVGFDTKGAESVIIKAPLLPSKTFLVPDTREGWVESLKRILLGYFYGRQNYVMDYSFIRPAGQPIKGFGGISSGPSCLEELHKRVRRTLDPLTGKPLTITAIVDIMNHIGVCVVSGNVRRTAEIAFGDPKNEEYIDLKNYDKNPERIAYGWTSNNTVFADLGMDYNNVVDRIISNGEPGFAWLENMRKYARMNEEMDSCSCNASEGTDTILKTKGFKDCHCGRTRDARALGGNPCLEQTLESFEICCLVETFPFNHSDMEDFLRTLKFAFLYAKTVTLGKTHWTKTNRVMLRNRRIGCSMSGIAQFLCRRGLHTFREWCTKGYSAIEDYDREFSEYFAIPRSIKKTSIKPSGTVSLLAGATPGLHYPESRYYIRRIRLEDKSPLIEPLKAAGYEIEKAIYEKDTVVVSIPIDMGEEMRTLNEVSMWEQFSLAAFLQKYWADNQVSCTVTFDPVTEGSHISHALDYFQYQLKGISLLPRLPAGAYQQMPYEKITEEVYNSLSKKITITQWNTKYEMVDSKNIESLQNDEKNIPDKYCTNVGCM